MMANSNLLIEVLIKFLLKKENSLAVLLLFILLS
ncbi:hypothetical protein SAMN04489762_2496 [Terribacillus saccharophilus]|uniref:Uncharacterized protein n=1 Tax=Terribacillus saccharophilus TaxID=361277 RepID=A0AAX2EH53_9BACI|nr:hypothetical protein SAMN04489762_2496 [Terribacillus saccharophilus]